MSNTPLLFIYNYSNNFVMDGIPYLHAMDYWTAKLDQNSSVDILYLDFHKAFDTVPHRLFIKLEVYGIRGKLL